MTNPAYLKAATELATLLVDLDRRRIEEHEDLAQSIHERTGADMNHSVIAAALLQVTAWLERAEISRTP